jgi:hypothetical protein
MALKFKASETFWTKFYALSAEQKESAREKWEIFKVNPFDPRLRTHKIARLTAILGKAVFAADIEGDLRVTFYKDGDLIHTIFTNSVIYASTT